MKLAILSTLVAAAAAFAPVAPAARGSMQLSETKADLEALATTLNPLVKFYDPLNLAEAEFWGGEEAGRAQGAKARLVSNLRCNAMNSRFARRSLQRGHYRLPPPRRDQARTRRHVRLRRIHRPRQRHQVSSVCVGLGGGEEGRGGKGLIL